MPLRRLLALLGVALVAVSACSSEGGPKRTETVTVDAPTPTSSAATPSSSGSSSASGPATTLKPPASLTRIPGTCEGKLPLEKVGPAIDESLPGTTAFIVGRADPSIKRIAYINCRYGLSDPTANPALEIQVSLYPTTTVAAQRIDSTVTDYGNNGATATDVSPGGIPAHILTGGSGVDYANTTLVLAFGQRTVAISVSDVIAADRANDELTKLAVLAVKATQ